MTHGQKYKYTTDENEKSVVERAATDVNSQQILTKTIMAEEQKKQFKAKLTEEIEAGVYSNAVSVHVNANEIVLDMAYVLPNAPEPMLKVVSRINMSHKTAKSFLNVLSNAILDYENKSKNQ